MLHANATAERMLQCLKRLPNGPRVDEAVTRIIDAYRADDVPWVVGYSGGKDSTAVVKLIFQSLLRVRQPHKAVTIIYCDTGVEVPTAAALARDALSGLTEEADEFDLPIETTILHPRMRDRFFVKIIGRGYPPPTDKFRWCTDRLRINPVSTFLQSQEVKSATVVLGVRQSESATRSLTLREHGTSSRYWKTQRRCGNRKLFMPIIDFDIRDVWLVSPSKRC